jgi:hemolysin-activating ACP:hemolysin acyltransferase
MDYSLLGSVMSLVFNDNFYEKHRMTNIRNSVYRAIEHDKCFVHRVDGEIVGYCTWGFFRREEIDRDYWDGGEVFSRDFSDGLILFFPKFQCRAGRREVIRFIRDIQRFMWDNYPNVEIGEGLRLYPDGSKRDEKWHRKVA